MKTCEQVFAEVRHLLPPAAKLVSGGLEDARGTSDVDVLIYSADAEASYYSLNGFDREVNVLVTADPKRLRAEIHREVELELEQKFPALTLLARRAKKEGAGTEAAWAAVLGLQGCPYEAMADRDSVMLAAAVLA